MPDQKISALTDGVTAEATDRVPVSRAGVNKYITPAYVRTYLALGVDNTTNNATATEHGFLKKLSGVSTEFMNGAGNWATPAGGAALSGITAATGANTIASGNNHSQIWNWAPATDATTMFTVGETTAATGGTSTSGVPNQVIGKFTTLAASTASPLSVYSRGLHVFSVSPTARQILAYDGVSGNPAYSFASSPNSGMWASNASGQLNFRSAGTSMMTMDANGVRMYGSNGALSVTDIANQNAGFDWPASAQFRLSANTLLISDSAGAETGRITVGTYQASKAAADAVGYALNFRKARGTVASPTVITTGDDLATISGFGYVGATGTYVEAAQIKFDSNGAIADSTTGVGGVARVSTRKVAGTLTERLTIDNNETAAETSILVSINGAAPVRVSKGANDSGGAGFALLRIPN